MGKQASGSRRGRLTLAAFGMAGAAALITTAATASTAGSTTRLDPVATANPKAPGMAAAHVLAAGLSQRLVAQGSTRLENGTKDIPYYGYLGDGTLLPLAGDLPTKEHKVEASKTEPDKNTYLFLVGQTGADPSYDYGQHFLFQGHELGKGYITRINLDADDTHRVTLLASTDVDGKALPTFDGSTWDPWAERLLFTAEGGKNGGVWQATLSVPSRVEDISGAVGRGGYEGIQNDSDGNLLIVEDVGGVLGTTNKTARQPNSFLYRFVPADPANLKAGKLQVLQADSLRSGQPITFHDGKADDDIRSDDVLDLHTYGKSFAARWVTIHDTATDGSTPFDANALAKAKGGTPFKRPENGVFRPGSHFLEFVFTETGDTNANTEAGAAYGGFGGLFTLTLDRPGGDSGRLAMLYRGDKAHTGLDNLTFISADELIAGEDAGDTLHAQRNALDSAYLFNMDADYGNPATPEPPRMLAEGRDASATIDSSLSGKEGFQNDGDNEITGIHVSDGDPNRGGILGAKSPLLWTGGWRMFWTAQHGDNVTWEVIPNRQR